VEAFCHKEPSRRYTLQTLAEAISLNWTLPVLTIADLTALGQLLQRVTLPHLQELKLGYAQMNDKGIAALVGHRHRGATISQEAVLSTATRSATLA
jgi:hypothetical protein